MRNHLSFREVCDGCLGSLTRGVPGTLKNSKVPRKRYFKIPGVRTWLKTSGGNYITIFSTKNKIISKLLKEAMKVLTESHGRSTTDFSTFENWYLHEVIRIFKITDKTIEPEKLFREATDGFFEKASFDSNLEWFWFNDSYLAEILQFVSAEIHILTDVIPDFHKRFSFEEQSKLYLNTLKIPRDSFIKHIKFHTACPMASILDQDLPAKPSDFTGHYLIWTGSVKRYLKNILNRRNFNSKDTPLCLKIGMGFLQGIKRGCATVPSSFLYSEVISHIHAMTTPPELVPGWEYTDGFATKYSDPILQTFGATCEHVLKQTNKVYVPKPYEPSHNASFERSRGEPEFEIEKFVKGGAYMEVVHSLGLQKITKEVILKGDVGFNISYELPDMDEVAELCRIKYPSRFKFVDDDPLFKEYFPELFVSSPQLSRELSDTQVIPLCEPLKIRVITKGEALPAYLAKTLQKTMKSYINRFPSMILTTRPLKVDDFRDVWAREKAIESQLGINLKFCEHVSGDYKAATDKLNINFTKLIFERFMVVLNIPQADRDVYRSVLYEQRVHYPFAAKLCRDKKLNSLNCLHKANIEAKKLYKLEYAKWVSEGSNFLTEPVLPPLEFAVEQKNGQLMGSILSFPILCLANLICYKCALDEYINIDNKLRSKKFVNVFDLPVLINGDDIYFRSNPVFYEIWKKYIGIAGFVLSIGKNYVHKSIFTINSQCFRYNDEQDSIDEITYLNVGLLIGQSKSGILGEKLPTWDLYNKVTVGSYNKVDSHNRFFYYHKDSIAQISKNGNYNLFLPKLLGGLGFIRPDPAIPVKITRFQAQLGTYFHNRIIAAYKTPEKELHMSQAHLIDEHSPDVYDTYLGDQIFQFIKKDEEVPEGYLPLNLSKRTEHLFVHDWGNFEPKLEFRSIDSQTLKHFRESVKKYQGDKCWFGAESAISGNYPYVLVRRVLDDVETYQENLREVVYNKVLENIKDYFEVKEKLKPLIFNGNPQVVTDVTTF
ncbi:RNA-dependent RNA polymerase [Hubei narna-like virus 9]|uniref:RNA-dependent RNA polymerase n=1 Tax=Hubei narna-like virus 9 TaxID=1922962 RepID=UPI00090ADA64|nr:RNA-dependent RNA polymerase [Hubei narna-like virus 9]APG77206.1 RNA-dependent RNA polymerase [Hubei narna-like virus 9]